MKGYSFDELVKLAMAAVKRAGDTMAGDLTTPKVLVSGAQGTEVNALTRKDYVDGELSKKLNLAGDGTIAGNLTIATGAPILCLHEVDTTKKWLLVADSYGARFQPDSTVTENSWSSGPDGTFTCKNPHSQSPQGPNANSLTRKDYVDTELNKKLDLIGGTMTGALYINQELQSRALSVNDISSGARLAIVPQGSNERFTIDMYPANSSPYQVIEFRGSDRTTSFKQIVSCDVAPVAATHLTRKDYVDSQVATRAPSEHTHTWDQVTSKPTTFPPSSHTHPWSEVTGAPVTATRWPEWSEVTSKPTTFTPSAHTHPWSEITSKPTTFPPSAHTHPWSEVTGAPVTATRWPEWSEVASKPSTFTPSAHTHTAAEGNADIVASGHSQIGTYMLAQSRANTVRTPGYTVAGSSLRPASAGDRYVDGQSLAGTWKLLGAIWDESNQVANRTSLWIRIS